ncbi:MAG: hypothetical protein HBSAPP03_10130 [Phycisphaerae bacterium]|nr:MAG: hypothetical protein HBSAPP03_10130 [Phycisphaerae bacterium]
MAERYSSNVLYIIAAMCGLSPASAPSFPAPWAAQSQPSVTKTDERVVLFPAAGYLDADGLWRVDVHGWIFEPEEDDRLRSALQRKLAETLGLDPADAEGDRFRARAALFLADNERGKRVVIEVEGTTVRTLADPSGPEGHFDATLWLDPATMPPTDPPTPIRALTLRVPLPEGDARAYVTSADLIPPEGLSVVSDIDDTVKVSNVRDRAALLQNTFVRPFEPAPGMAALYQRLHARGAAFHYVSASPWQLFPPLAEFLRDAGFPPGHWSMREFRLKDRTLLALFDDPEQYKMAAIGPLLERWPKRSWVLIGDSGEKDPEAYLALARQHPGRVVKVLIRDVSGEPRDAERYRRLMEGLDPALLDVFETPPESLELPPK